MLPPLKSAARALTGLTLALIFSGPLQAAPQAASPAAPSLAVEKPAEILPKLDLTPKIIYELLLAEIAGNRGQLQLAVDTYVDLAKSTRDPRIVRRAAEVAVFARRPDAALAMAQLWTEIEPESPQAQQMLVGLLLSAQRLDEASGHLAKLLALEGDKTGDTLLRLNRLLARYPDKQAVRRLIEKLTQPYDGLAEAHFARAQAAVNTGDNVHALAEIERAQALRPQWQDAVLFKAQIQQRSSNTQAMDTLRDYLGTYPDAREVRLAYARTLVGEKRYKDARAQFNVLLNGSKDDPEAIYAVALLSLQLNDLGVAETQFKRLLELGFGDANLVRLYLGQIAEQSKRPQEALRWYGLVTPGEQYLPAQLRRAKLLAQLGRLEDGRVALQQAAADHPSERIPLLIAEAQLLSDAGRSADAFELLNGKLSAQPDQPELLYESAMLAEKIGRFGVFERKLRKLIRLKPNYAHAYNALGYSLADRDVRLDEAEKLIDKALSLAPDDAFILDSKGWVLYRRGDDGGALGYLQKAYKLRSDPEIAAHLGEVLWKLGRHDEAVQTWNAAASANPGNEALTATIKKFKP